MNKFSDVVKNDTPRMVVMFQRDGANERFQWGLVGSLPLLSLIGYIGRVQSGLTSGNYLRDCPESALVIAWDPSNKSFYWFVHPEIPTDSLCGMLEAIKAVLVGTQMVQQSANQKVQMYDSNGNPT